MAQQLRGSDSDRLIKAQVHRQRLVAAIDGKCPPFGGDHRCIGKDLLQTWVVERRRHQQQPEIVAQPVLNIEQQRQRQIGLQAAFVEFIEDHQPHAAQFRIVLQHPGENALRHHFEARRGADAGFGAHAVADRFARLFIQQFGEALCHVAGRQPARFQQKNFSGNIPLFEDLQRQPGRFTGARGRIQQDLRGML
ncbi:hypothetical protein D3C72_907790 [compost metagenome]